MPSVRCESRARSFVLTVDVCCLSTACNNTSVCPRFSPNSPCIGSLKCDGGTVTEMYLCMCLFVLPSLCSSFLSDEKLSGTISSSIGQLSALSRLYLQRNELGGSIPTTIGQLTALRILYLHTNQLSGTIPPTIVQLSAIQEM